jgi:4'-phosphopantetheinyl transferase
MIQVYALNIDFEIDYASFNRLASTLPEETLARIRTKRMFGDFKRSLYGELLSRTVLASRLGVSGDLVRTGRDSAGKPVVNLGGVAFNVSHSDRMVCCALSRRLVGVDVETYRQLDLRLMRGQFSSSELERMDALSGENAQRLAIQLWTLKESYVKMTGSGLGVPLGKLSFTLENNRAGLSIEGVQSRCKFRLYSLDHDRYSLAVCGNEEFSPVVCVYGKEDL